MVGAPALCDDEETMTHQAPETSAPPGRPGGGADVNAAWVPRRAARSSSDSYVAGVAGGLAEHLGVDTFLVRVFFVAAAVAGGLGVLLYLALWLMLPIDTRAEVSSPGLESAQRRGLRPRARAAGARPRPAPRAGRAGGGTGRRGGHLRHQQLPPAVAGPDRAARGHGAVAAGRRRAARAVAHTGERVGIAPDPARQRRPGGVGAAGRRAWACWSRRSSSSPPSPARSPSHATWSSPACSAWPGSR